MDLTSLATLAAAPFYKTEELLIDASEGDVTSVVETPSEDAKAFALKRTDVSTNVARFVNEAGEVLAVLTTEEPERILIYDRGAWRFGEVVADQLRGLFESEVPHVGSRVSASGGFMPEVQEDVTPANLAEMATAFNEHLEWCRTFLAFARTSGLVG